MAGALLRGLTFHGVSGRVPHGTPRVLAVEAMRGQTRGIAATLSRLNPSRASLYASPGIDFVWPEPRDRVARRNPRTLRHWVAASVSLGFIGTLCRNRTAVLLGACAILFARPGRPLEVHDAQAVVAH